MTNTAAQRLASQPEIKPLTLRFQHLTTGVTQEVGDKINGLFRRGSIEDRTAFARELMDLFGNATISDVVQAATEVFGKITPQMGYGSSRFMITIARNDQFRVWYGLPCDFGENHVESNGRNYLLEVSGDRQDLLDLAKKLMPTSTEVILPNGVLLYLYLGRRF